MNLHFYLAFYPHTTLARLVQTPYFECLHELKALETTGGVFLSFNRPAAHNRPEHDLPDHIYLQLASDMSTNGIRIKGNGA